jgi:hypothetical protein
MVIWSGGYDQKNRLKPPRPSADNNE